MTGRRVALPLLAIALLLVACSGRGGERGATPSGAATGSLTAGPSTSAFCRDLGRLDTVLRDVRSLDDRTAGIPAYRSGSTRLDEIYRRVRDVAPAGFDLAPMEYANGRFGQLARELPTGLPGAQARADVILILESYKAAVYDALVRGCGASSVVP